MSNSSSAHMTPDTLTGCQSVAPLYLAVENGKQNNLAGKYLLVQSHLMRRWHQTEFDNDKVHPEDERRVRLGMARKYVGIAEEISKYRKIFLNLQLIIGI